MWGAPTEGWDAVLLFENNTVASVFGSVGHWSGTSVSLNAGRQMFTVSGTNFSESGDQLVAFGTTPLVVVSSVIL